MVLFAPSFPDVIMSAALATPTNLNSFNESYAAPADDLSNSSVTEGSFLFVTFKGESSPLTEQVYFAVSRDGRNWEVLGDGAPVLVSELGEKGVRDPFIIRSVDGDRFFLIATDLSIHLNPDWGRAVRRGSKSLVIWESEDLVHWSEPRLVPVAAADAGCAWAPEAVYDEERGDYLVFWASTGSQDNFNKHRIWATRTSDFRSFGEPFIYIERPSGVIDTTIVRSGGQYQRFSKDEESKAITLEVSENLLGPWRPVPDFSLASLRGYEGPQCYLLEPERPGSPATWCLLLDFYSKSRGYQPFLSSDLSAGQFDFGCGFHFPFHFRHGSVLRITNEELERLEAGR